jgi:hypothetical protein
MNPSRILLGGLVGGLAMFAWGAVAHMALPIGDMGIRSLPREDMILPAMKFAINERGFYMFPGMEALDGREMSEAAMKEWETKYQQGPRGILIFDPTGGQPMSAAQLGAEFASNVLAALLLAIILARVPAGRAGRMLLGGAMGIFAWASIDVSYWNWYRFPGAFTRAQSIEQGVGGLVTGLAIALVLGRSGRRPAEWTTS